MSRLIISAGVNETFDFALPMGVGLVDMSINLSVFLQKRAEIVQDTGEKYEKLYGVSVKNPQNSPSALPREIVFIGSAGLYKEGEILGIYESFNAGNVEISSLESKSYSPISCEISSLKISDSIVPRETKQAKRSRSDVSVKQAERSATADVSVKQAKCSCKDVSVKRVNSSNFITTDESLAFRLFKSGYFLENMEFYAVLKVAQIFKIPAYGIFVATNFCNKSAHADFIKNHEIAKAKLANYLKTKGLI